MSRFSFNLPTTRQVIFILFLLWIIEVVADIFIEMLSPGVSLVVGIASIIIFGITGFIAILQVIVGWPSRSTTAVVATSTQPLTTSRNLVSQSRPSKWKVVLGCIVIVLGTLILSYPGIIYPSYRTSSCTPYSEWKFGIVLGDKFHPDPPNASMIGNECIGISDGGFKLDSSGFPDSLDMVQAAQTFRDDGDKSKANDTWDKSIGEAHEDAEPLIYEQDLAASNSQQYYDVLVVTMLSGNSESINIGQDELRGFYSALKNYDFSPARNIPIRFLIANIGSDATYAGKVEEQIGKLAQQDIHLLGILGWPISINNQVINTIQNLAQVKLPTISPTASADGLSQLNPYFFRMVPPNEKQSEAHVSLIEEAFNAAHLGNEKQIINVAVLTTKLQNDEYSPYSSSLAKDFKDYLKQLKNSRIQIVFDNSYIRLQKAQLQNMVDNALAQGADIIYLPGYSEDAQTVLDYLQSKGGNIARQVKVVGGDGLAHIKDYPYSGYLSSANQRLYYTSFTVPHNNCQNDPSSSFYHHYYEVFHLCPDNDAMLAYDSAWTMLQSVTQTMNACNCNNITPNDLWSTLKQINNLHPLSGGATGNITFQNGDRADQIITSFSVNSDGYVQPL